jgi:hypothetical protein
MPTQATREKMLELSRWVSERVTNNSKDFSEFTSKYDDDKHVPLGAIPAVLNIMGDRFQTIAVPMITSEDVADDESIEWFKENFINGVVFSYVYNLDEPMFSEFGSIGFSIENRAFNRKY